MHADTVDELSDADLDEFPIWIFVPDGSGKLRVRPAKRSRPHDLSGRLVGTSVTLANGNLCRALLGNLDLTNARSTRHFLTLSLYAHGSWFHLARYHDHDFDVRGPQALASFLGLALDDVFPIAYDVRVHVKDPLGVATGTILANPPERLSAEELIALAVP